MDGKKIYEPPVAISIGMGSAYGQVVILGECLSGGAPFLKCENGLDVGKGSCIPGGQPEINQCIVGYRFDTKPQCKTGSAALVGCSLGSLA